MSRMVCWLLGHIVVPYKMERRDKVNTVVMSKCLRCGREYGEG